MTRPRTWWCLAVVAGLTAALALGLWSAPPVDPIAIRDTLFASRLDKESSRQWTTDAPHPDLVASVQRDAAAARTIADGVFGAHQLAQLAALPTAERAMRLAGLLPGLGGRGCGTVSAIEEKAAILRDNHHFGCCSDFNEVYLLLALATGTVVREVNTTQHTFAEVWLPESAEWMLVDAQLGIVARSGRTRSGFLSAWGLRQALIQGRPVELQHLPKQADAAQVQAWVRTYYRDPASWQTLRVAQRSDVVSQSAFLTSAARYAKWAAQFAAYVIRVLPGHAELQDPA